MFKDNYKVRKMSVPKARIHGIVEPPKRFKRGQATVEFALVLSVLLLLLFGIIEVSRLVFMNSAVENGAREGVRYVSLSPPGTLRYDNNALRQAVISKMALTDSNQVNVSVQTGAVCDFCPITVTVTYPWTSFVGFLGMGPIELQARSTTLIQDSR